MPDSRKHRSAGPKDHELFGPDRRAELREAAEHLRWLRSRGYADRASLELVGNRFDLVARQRDALGRGVCGQDEATRRRKKELGPDALAGATLAIDGFNVLTTLEVALGGGLVLLCDDGCARDLASLHGTWRRVEETAPALELAGEALADLGVATCDWFLDAPVSNSGRLRNALLEAAAAHGWTWGAHVVRHPDVALVEHGAPVASADRAVIDRAEGWVSLARRAVVERVPDAWLLDLSG